jgi:hypothetical protein
MNRNINLTPDKTVRCIKPNYSNSIYEGYLYEVTTCDYSHERYAVFTGGGYIGSYPQDLFEGLHDRKHLSEFTNEELLIEFNKRLR